MKTNAFRNLLGIIGVAVAASGCTTDAILGDDGLNTDGASGGGQNDGTAAAPQGDSGTVSVQDDGGSVMVDTDAATQADAASCGAFTTGSDTCDHCIQTSCCGQAATCDLADDAGTDDAGLTSCEQLVSCTSDICAADGGPTLSDCEMTCGPTYSTSVQAIANDLLTCVSANCAAVCQ